MPQHSEEMGDGMTISWFWFIVPAHDLISHGSRALTDEG